MVFERSNERLAVRLLHCNYKKHEQRHSACEPYPTPRSILHLGLIAMDCMYSTLRRARGYPTCTVLGE